MGECTRRLLRIYWEKLSSGLKEKFLASFIAFAMFAKSRKSKAVKGEVREQDKTVCTVEGRRKKLPKVRLFKF